VPNLLDRIVSYISPTAGIKRLAARGLHDQMISGTTNQYSAAQINRLNELFGVGGGSHATNDSQDPVILRDRAWQLWQDNPHCRKAVSMIVAQVIGSAFDPEPNPHIDTEPDADFTAFGEASLELFKKWSCYSDWYGTPGQGGLHFGDQLRLIKREAILSGECFIRKHYESQWYFEGVEENPIPFSIELIEASRLASDDLHIARISPESNNFIYRGIEYSKQTMRIQAYHFYKVQPQDSRLYLSSVKPQETVRVPANEIIHWFIKERINQQRGVTWLAPVIRTLQYIKEYEWNELVASSVASCVGLVIKSVTPQQAIGLQAPSGGSNTDTDGNKLTRMSPGMIAQIAPNEEVETINPSRQSSEVADFANHLLRGCAAGMPGVKASSIHGDYRQSSYSSEKAADNDCWRETEILQSLFAASVAHPIYCEVLDVGMRSGYFDRVLDNRTMARRKFQKYRKQLSDASWHGPVAKSVNPMQDYKAVNQAIKNGTLSLPDAARLDGYNWRENFKLTQKVIDFAKKLKLPEAWLMEKLGFTVQLNLSKADNQMQSIDLLEPTMTNQITTPQEMAELQAELAPDPEPKAETAITEAA